MNFTVYKPLIGHDEDAPAYADDKLLVVCDGLGGGGQNTYMVDLNGTGTKEKRSSAYLGSRVISKACQEFVFARYDALCENMRSPDDLIDELKEHISKALNDYVAKHELKNLVKGRSMQMLPSTLAAVVYKHYEDRTDALVISAGDSRAFVLTPENGLQQISVDDVAEGFDAYAKTSSMTNNIRQDQPFHINYKYYSLPRDCIIFACTDGCFDYISTPMELEFRFEYAISKCGDLLDPVANSLGESFGNILVSSGLKDDCTVAGAILGYSDSEGTKRRFTERGALINKNYRQPYAKFDADATARKAEVSSQLPALEAKVKKLRADVEETLKNAVLEAGKKEILEDPASPAEAGNVLKAKLRELEVYQKFISELDEAAKKASASEDALKEEYISERVYLIQEFKRVRCDSIIENIHKPDVFASCGKNAERNKLAAEYKKLNVECRDLYNEYKGYLANLPVQIDKLAKVESKELNSADVFAPVQTEFNNLQNSYYTLVSKIQERNRCRDALGKYLSEKDADINQEFVDAWKSKFSAYSKGEIYVRYTRCMDLQKKIKDCSTLTDEAKIKKFTEFFNSNVNAFTDYIKNNEALYRSVCGAVLDELSAVEKEYEEKKKYGSEFDEKKTALWTAYKPGYELFEHAPGGKI